MRSLTAPPHPTETGHNTCSCIYQQQLPHDDVPAVAVVFCYNQKPARLSGKKDSAQT